MAVKDIKEDYLRVELDYFELLSNLKEMEREVADNIISPESVDNLKEMIAPLKRNYEFYSWIIYLLNKPARKKKYDVYEKQNKKQLAKANGMTTDKAIEEDRQVIDKLKL